MSNYTKATNFTAKDSLNTGNVGKIVKGSEIDAEFVAIASAISSKANLDSPNFTGTPSLPTGTTAITQTAGNSTQAVATTQFVQAALAAVYPVGSIYTNATVSTNPATLLGFGTWVAFGAGRVAIGDGGGFTAGATGGSADAVVVSHTHTFTTDAAGAHNHTYQRATSLAPQSGSATNCLTQTTTDNTSAVGDHTHTGTTASAGSSGTNANLQPYVVVYMWRRTD